MKLVMDERVKHRLVGLAVILSIGAIFAPAIMKKSNQRLDGNMSVSVQLPPKPEQPNIDMVEKKEMFDSVKVAHVELPALNDEKPLANLAKAKPIGQLKTSSSKTNELAGEVLALADEDANFNSTSFTDPEQDQRAFRPEPKISHAAAAHKIATGDILFSAKTVTKTKTITKTAKSSKAPIKQASKPVIKKLIAKKTLKNGYTVQLATFTNQHNANLLISKLKAKGYTATYNKVKTGEGIVYKVVVGQLIKREQAQHLQQQLASAVQIKGFIVATGEG